MATSGSVDFSVTRDDIITEALELLGVVEANGSISSEDIASCARTLNMLIKVWQTDGLNVFQIKRGYLFSEQNKSEYTLSTSGDHWTYSYTKQDTDGAAASGANTIDLTDATDFTNGDNIGVYQDDGTMLWTTGTKSGNTITLATPTTDEVADGNTVYFYTSKGDTPEAVVEASLRNDSLNDRPLDLMPRSEWNELSNKTTDGKITQVYYDERVSNSTIFAWPQSSDPRDIMLFWIKRTVEDFDASGNNPDFPQRWYFPLAFNLAVTIGPKYGVPATNPNYQEIKDQAVFWYNKAQDYDSLPEASIRMGVDEGFDE